MPEETSVTTPVESGNPDTTPPAAVTAGTTPQPEGGNETQPDIDKIIQKRLERERKKWESESEEKAKRARMDEAERLRAELADKDKAIAERDAQIKRERTLRSLAGKVIDPDDALAIAERANLVSDDGEVDIDALLKAKPYLNPAPAGAAPIDGAKPRPAGKSDPGDLTSAVKQHYQI